jgi:hypothetical protein
LPRLGLRGIAALGFLVITSVPRLIELELLPVNASVVFVVLVLVAIQLWLVYQTVRYRLLLRRQRQERQVI